MLGLILGGIFMLFSVLLGIAVTSLLRIIFTFEERICFSIIVGHTFSAIIVYLFSYLHGSLDFFTIGIGFLLICRNTHYNDKEKGCN
ncbi:MAG: hypothetical protein QXM51_04780 [Thermoproteota archaeon]